MPKRKNDLPEPKLGHSVPEAARIAGLSENYFWKLIKIGRLQSQQFGRRRIILHSELEKFIEKGVREPITAEYVEAVNKARREKKLNG